MQKHGRTLAAAFAVAVFGCSQEAGVGQATAGNAGAGGVAGAAASAPDTAGVGGVAAGIAGALASSGAGGAGLAGSGGAAGAAAGGAAGDAGAGGSSGMAGAGGAAAPGCAGKAYPVCIDFESGSLDGKWSLGKNSNGTSAKVEAGKAAHGQYALHLSGFHMGTSTLVHTTELGGIKDVMWGRYYLYMSPGAPTGHGGMVRAFDQPGNWYELGFEYNSFLGNWHPKRPNAGGWIERAMRTHDTITGDSWVCVEFVFDGAKPSAAQIWYDGKQVSYYSDISYCDSGQGPGAGCAVTFSKANQFTSFDIGAEFYHGTSLASDMWAGDGAPTIKDAYIDDVVLDTERVGCL